MHDESYILGMTGQNSKMELLVKLKIVHYNLLLPCESGTVGKTKNCSLQFTITL